MLANTAGAVNITYQVNRSAPNPVGCGLAVGTITTDGTLGLISSANFVRTAVNIYRCVDGGGYEFQTTGPLEAANLWADQLLLYMSWVPGSPPTIDGQTRAYIAMPQYVFNNPVCTLDCNPWAIVSYVNPNQVFNPGPFTFDGVQESISDGTPRDVTAPIVTIGVFAHLPEPGSMVLLTMGLAGLGLSRRRKA
jgi:hypothetical protein